MERSEPAFPQPNFRGLTMRDFFAAQAMSQGMAVLVASKHNLNDYQLDQLARTAYLAADAMLRAREKLPSA